MGRLPRHISARLYWVSGGGRLRRAVLLPLERWGEAPTSRAGLDKFHKPCAGQDYDPPFPQGVALRDRPTVAATGLLDLTCLKFPVRPRPAVAASGFIDGAEADRHLGGYVS